MQSLRGRLLIAVLIAALVFALAAAALTRGAARGAILLAGVIGFGVAAIAVSIAAAPTRRGLRAFEDAVGRLATADDAGPLERLPLDGDDEIAASGRAVRSLADRYAARAEELVRDRDDRERLLAHMSDGVALIDAAGRIRRCNRSLADMLGAPLPAGDGTPFQEFARSPELDALLQAGREQARSVETDIRLWAPRARHVQATVHPLGPAEGGSVVLIMRDLTELETLNRMRQDFVANVSHELRTPLTSLRGYAETLLDGGLDDAEHRASFVRIMLNQTVRLQALVEDLLSLAELERGDAAQRRERVDLREVVDGEVSGLRGVAEAAGLTLALAPGEPVAVHGDRVRLSQAAANLLENAVKYTERGGVTAAVWADADGAWLEVQDTGPGIPVEDQPRIFERFYRVDKARTREKGGTGLGLAIVKHIATQHGGEVSVASEPGNGSRFRLCIPQ